MRAVLLFSAVLHIAVIGGLAAFATRWLFASRRPEEPSFPEYVKAAAMLGAAVFVVGTVVMWLGRGFGTAVTAGLAGGLIAAVSFLLALGVLPNPWATSTAPPSIHARISNASLVAALVLTEVIAFCLLIATAGTAAPFSLTMRAGAVLPAGSWDGAAADTVRIDFDRRHRRRIQLRTEAGQDLLLDLPQAARLRHGDGLRLEDGRVVRVEARPEPLLELHAHDPALLVRIAWHLGNRHLPVQMVSTRIRIRADHVIADMIRGLGGHVHALEAPFDPEAGAYAGGHHHHGDEDGHEH